MLLSVIANLGMLGYFKYGQFLLDSFSSLMLSIGVAYHPAHYDIVLPVGISFYTFATMSYTLDVYLRRAAPARNLLDYALFVTFFPHLVAGPKAWSVLRGMVGQNAALRPILPTFSLLSVAAIVGALVLTHWLMRARTLEAVVARTPAAVVCLVWALMAFAIVIAQGSGNAFIYFQF
jgi:hypothetical protein